MTSKLYEIRDYSHEPGWVHYVSEDTSSVEDAWTTALPVDPKEAVKFKDAPKAKQFEKKSEAKLLLDTLKSARLQDWQKNGWYYKANGYQKPVWKIYAIEDTPWIDCADGFKDLPDEDADLIDSGSRVG